MSNLATTIQRATNRFSPLTALKNRERHEVARNGYIRNNIAPDLAKSMRITRFAAFYPGKWSIRSGSLASTPRSTFSHETSPVASRQIFVTTLWHYLRKIATLRERKQEKEREDWRNSAIKRGMLMISNRGKHKVFIVMTSLEVVRI